MDTINRGTACTGDGRSVWDERGERTVARVIIRLGLSLGWEHCMYWTLYIVHCILTLYSHRASLHSGI